MTRSDSRLLVGIGADSASAHRKIHTNSERPGSQQIAQLEVTWASHLPAFAAAHQIPGQLGRVMQRPNRWGSGHA